ncbi:type II toxin-antitoxin system HipA family toxin [Opitutales bacterium]|nr:type II toxin-antitoxin system HipA family toxin [Opitutales bacterium]MDB2682471.1 type II toxin-antitoxin system HipA family toxin [Opitutales bacterium]
MRLEVRYTGDPVGVLDDSTGRLLFQYDQGWLGGGVELSPFYLPLQEGVIAPKSPFEGSLPGVFADSLPDYWGRSIMDRRLREAGINPATVSVLKRLALVGGGGFGALSYHPAESDEAYEAQSLADAVCFSREVIRMESATLPGTAVMQQAGSNPGGRYPKLSVGWDPSAGQLVVGAQDYPEGYIPCLLKLDLGKDMPQGEEGLCRREFAMLESAESCGLRVPDRWLLEGREADGGSHAHLLVRRFDRAKGERLHMHSFSGIAHTLSVRYGNSYEELMRTVSALTRDQREVDEMFRRMAFNVLLGNRDDHVRNHGFLMPGPNVWKLSPAFDLTPTPQLEEHSLSVNGKWSGIKLEDLQAVGRAFSVRGIDEILQKVSDAASEAQL